MTEPNLKSAYAGESQAHMRYTIYTKKANDEGYFNVARLFTAVAFAEQLRFPRRSSVLEALQKIFKQA